MVLEANGYEVDGPSPPTVAAALIDLRDTVLVVSNSSDREGSKGTAWMNCVNFCIAAPDPRNEGEARRAPILAGR